MPQPESPPTGDTRSLGRTLIDEFAAGWSKGLLDRIMSVYSENAVLYESPFGEPLRGAPAIRRYWSDVPLHQSEVKVTTGEIYSAGPWFSTEFKTVFRRRRTGEWVEVKGAIFCETEGGLVSEMRMYWNRSARPG